MAARTTTRYPHRHPRQPDDRRRRHRRPLRPGHRPPRCAFHPEVVDLATELVSADDPVPMAHALLAYLHLMSTDPARHRRADATPRGAIRAGVGQRAGAPARRRHRRLGVGRLARRRPPARRPAAAVAHRPAGPHVGPPARLLRRRRREPARPAVRSLPASSTPTHPHTAFVRGHAGLRAGGGRALRRGRGGRAGRRRRQPRRRVGDPRRRPTSTRCTGQVDDGIRFLADRTARLGRRQPLHRAQLVAPRRSSTSRPDRSTGCSPSTTPRSTTPSADGVPLEMLDASALLWRLRLDGTTPGGRFARLADAWAPKAARRALVRLQRPARHHGARRRRPHRRGPRRSIARLEQWLAIGSSGTNVRDDRRDRPARPAARIVAFAEDRYDDVVAELAAHPPGAPPLRWLARPARRAPAHAPRVRAPGRAARPGPGAHGRAARRPRHQRLRLGPAGPGAPQPR